MTFTLEKVFCLHHVEGLDLQSNTMTAYHEMVKQEPGKTSRFNDFAKNLNKLHADVLDRLRVRDPMTRGNTVMRLGASNRSDQI